MHIDIQARGFSLTEFLLAAVEERAESFRDAFPNLNPQIQVRLFDVNGNRGGVDKGCLLHARLGRGRRSVVVSDVDSDLVPRDRRRRSCGWIAPRGRRCAAVIAFDLLP